MQPMFLIKMLQRLDRAKQQQRESRQTADCRLGNDGGGGLVQNGGVVKKAERAGKAGSDWTVVSGFGFNRNALRIWPPDFGRKKKQPEFRLLLAGWWKRPGRLPGSLLGSSFWSGLFGSGFAKTVAEFLNATTHVVHGFLGTGVERV